MKAESIYVTAIVLFVAISVLALSSFHQSNQEENIGGKATTVKYKDTTGENTIFETYFELPIRLVKPGFPVGQGIRASVERWDYNGAISTDGFDNFCDNMAPPAAPDADYVNYYFDNPMSFTNVKGNTLDFNNWRKDCRAPFTSGETKIWLLKVSSPRSWEYLGLQWSKLDVPLGYTARLVDLQTGEELNMRQETNHQFNYDQASVIKEFEIRLQAN